MSASCFDPALTGHVYTTTKIASEMLCHDYQTLYNVPFTVLRYGIPYGPRMRPSLVIPIFMRKAIERRADDGRRRWQPEPQVRLRRGPRGSARAGAGAGGREPDLQHRRLGGSDDPAHRRDGAQAARRQGHRVRARARGRLRRQAGLVRKGGTRDRLDAEGELRRPGMERTVALVPGRRSRRPCDSA